MPSQDGVVLYSEFLRWYLDKASASEGSAGEEGNRNSSFPAFKGG